MQLKNNRLTALVDSVIHYVQLHSCGVYYVRHQLAQRGRYCGTRPVSVRSAACSV